MNTSSGWKGEVLAAMAVLLVASTNQAQTVVNGSATGPVGNSALTDLPGWLACNEPSNNSPDVCDMSFTSWNGGTTVTAAASPDGGSWIGLANGVDPVEQECVIGHMTGLVAGNDYDLRFYGACFGTGEDMYANGEPAIVTVFVGTTEQEIVLPMVAEQWTLQTIGFTATADEMDFTLQTFTGDGYASLDGFVVTASGIGLDEAQNSIGMQVHPNPANEMISITLNSTSGAVRMDVLDMNGRTVLSEGTTGAVAGTDRRHMDIRGLSAGLYHIRVLTSNGQQGVRRFVKD